MRVGVLKEIKSDEFRVALTPAGARELIDRGHEVLVERGAGAGSAFPDEAYVAVGAGIAPDADSVFQDATLLLKVKEPLEQEWLRLQPHHVLFTYLHLAPNATLTSGLIESGATCVAYETVETRDGHLPLLGPMSEIAGRLAPHVGAYFLGRPQGGKGKLLSGATGVAAGKVVVLGAGIAGSNAAMIAAGMRGRVTVLDINIEPLMELERYLPSVQPLMSNSLTIEQEVEAADLVIAAVLVHGGRAPRLVSAEVVGRMQPGSVIVDISIDQGGVVETSRMTTHSEPTYVERGVIHYCVGNMPGSMPITATMALTSVTLPYVLALADQGLVAGARGNPALARGINVMEGKLTNKAVAASTGNPYFPLETLLPIEYV